MLCQSGLCCRLIVLSHNKQTPVNKTLCAWFSAADKRWRRCSCREKASVLIEILSFYFLHLKVVLMRPDMLLCVQLMSPSDCSWPLWWSDQGLCTEPLSCFKPEVITLQRLSCLNFGAACCSFKTHFHGSASLESFAHRPCMCAGVCSNEWRFAYAHINMHFLKSKLLNIV